MGITKPTRQFFEYILRSEGKSNVDTFFVDDYEENVVAARKLGIATFHYVDDPNFSGEEKIKRLFGSQLF
jgi:putative hydrolase of the HAD superfamily